MKIFIQINCFLLVMVLFASCASDTKTDTALEDASVSIETTPESPAEIIDQVTTDTVSQVDSKPLAKVEKEIQPAVQKEEKRPVKKKVIKRPIITFQEPTHQFGELKAGEKYEHKFMFKNTGNSDLVIEGATPSCGCTVPSYPFIPISPGETGYIGIIYNSVGKSGHQTPDIKVKTNANPAIYTISLVGEVIEK